MTPETSEQRDGGQLEVSLGTAQRLYDMAFENYSEAFKKQHTSAATYWDGYCRAIEEIIRVHHHE